MHPSSKRVMLVQALQDSLQAVPNRKQISEDYQLFYDEYYLIFKEQFDSLCQRNIYSDTIPEAEQNETEYD